MNARLLNHTTKFLLVIALGAISALACTSARASNNRSLGKQKGWWQAGAAAAAASQGARA